MNALASLLIWLLPTAAISQDFSCSDGKTCPDMRD
jgi:hypothetical protein